MNPNKTLSVDTHENPNQNLTNLQTLLEKWKRLSSAHEVIMTNLHGDVIDNFDSRLTTIHVMIMGTDILTFKLPIALNDIVRMQRHIEAVEVEPRLSQLFRRAATIGCQAVQSQPQKTAAEIADDDPYPFTVVYPGGRPVRYYPCLEDVYRLERDLDRTELRRRLIQSMPKFHNAGIRIFLDDGDIKWIDKDGLRYTCLYTPSDVTVILKEIQEDLASQMYDDLAAKM